MIDYERFMRQQLKKLNPVQQVAYSLIKGDARFISTLIDISKEPSKADNNYMMMSQPYIGLFANGAEQWGERLDYVLYQTLAQKRTHIIHCLGKDINY